MFPQDLIAVRCVNDEVIHKVALTKKQNSLMIYLQMMRIRKCAVVGYFHFFSIDYTFLLLNFVCFIQN